MAIRTKCKHCKKTFDARRFDAVYCGPSCRSAASKERREKRTQASRGANAGRSYALTSAFTKSINKAKAKTPADGAAVALAKAYAKAIDGNPDGLDKLGPQMLAVLVQLGMTPKSRVEQKPGGEQNDGRRPIDELRARRDDRQHRAPALDPAARRAHP